MQSLTIYGRVKQFLIPALLWLLPGSLAHKSRRQRPKQAAESSWTDLMSIVFLVLSTFMFRSSRICIVPTKSTLKKNQFPKSKACVVIVKFREIIKETTSFINNRILTTAFVSYHLTWSPYQAAPSGIRNKLGERPNVFMAGWASTRNTRKRILDTTEEIESQFSSVPRVPDIVFEVELGVLMMNG